MKIPYNFCLVAPFRDHLWGHGGENIDIYLLGNFTFIFFYFETNRLSWITLSYHHFENSIRFFVLSPFLGIIVESTGNKKTSVFTVSEFYIHILLFWEESIELNNIIIPSLWKYHIIFVLSPFLGVTFEVPGKKIYKFLHFTNFTFIFF